MKVIDPEISVSRNLEAGESLLAGIAPHPGH
jgi:hypothetical protein